MWYKTIGNEIYYLSADLLKDSAPGQPPPKAAIQYRNLQATDAFDHTLQYEGVGGPVVYGYYLTTVKKGIPVSLSQPPQFPPHPTFESLVEFMKKVNPKANTFELTSNLSLSKDANCVVLLRYGTYLMYWSPGETTFYTGDSIEHFKTYGDQSFEYRLNKELSNWEIKSPNSSWIPMFHGLRFNANLQVRNLDVGLNQIKGYQREVRAINDYVNLISAETISSTVGDVPVGRAVATRCMGCQANYREHFKVHMQRKELPFYLIYSAIGELTLEDPLKRTWTLIDNSRQGSKEAIEELRATIKLFLQKFTTKTELQIEFPKSGPHAMGSSLKFWPKHKPFHAPSTPVQAAQVIEGLENMSFVVNTTTHWGTEHPLIVATAPPPAPQAEFFHEEATENYDE